jgi:hydrogenase nickel incorporation protein HypA/HybF
MHELSLMASVMAIVDDARTAQGFAKVRVIRLQVGALCHAEPDALRFCFDAVTSGTVAAGSQLIIEVVPGRGHCPSCNQVVAMESRCDCCPHCADPQLRMIAGDALRVLDLEVE